VEVDVKDVEYRFCGPGVEKKTKDHFVAEWRKLAKLA